MTPQITVTTDIMACLALRRTVFIEEQGVSEADEQDDLDAVAVHLLATLNTRPIGTARLLRDGATGKIGRVCVLQSNRGTGLGAALIREAMTVSKGKATTAKLGAQVHAIGFYEALGFTATGPVYDDAGIDHRDMVQPL